IIAVNASGTPRWTYAPERLIGEGRYRVQTPDLASGHWSNAGLVVTADSINGEVNNTIVSLNPQTGAVRWRYPFKFRSEVHSLVAARELLIMCLTEDPVLRAPVWESLVGGRHTL